MDDTKRINLWSGPRNVSTAVMYAFRERHDTSVVDEPLYAHYLCRTGVEHPAVQDRGVLHSCSAQIVGI